MIAYPGIVTDNIGAKVVVDEALIEDALSNISTGEEELPAPGDEEPSTEDENPAAAMEDAAKKAE